MTFDEICAEVLRALREMTPEEEIRLMIDLGSQLTVHARGAYLPDQQRANPNVLPGFNELQHQIYGRIRDLHIGGEWTAESFVQGLSEKAEYYGIASDVAAAMKRSINSTRPSARIQ